MNRHHEERTGPRTTQHDVMNRNRVTRVVLTVGALFLLAVASGCQVRRYNNCVVNETYRSQGIRATIGQAENLSEGTSQEKRLNDVGNPDVSLPITP